MSGTTARMVLGALRALHASGKCTDHELSEAAANVRAFPGDYESDGLNRMSPREQACEALRLVRLP